MTLITLVIVSASTHAETVTNWSKDQGTGAISGANTSTVVLGNGTSNSADGMVVSGSLSGTLTLANTGESITMNGTLILVGISTGNTANDLRFGLFNTNGSATTNGWLGYSMGNSDSNHAGDLLERTSGNSAIYTSTTGATLLNSATATSNAEFTDGTYTFSLTLTRLASNGMSIAATLTSSGGFSLTDNFTDASGSTFSFNRVGFLSDGMSADQFTISGVTVVAIPEPRSSAMLAFWAIGIGFLRHRYLPSAGFAKITSPSRRFRSS